MMVRMCDYDRLRYEDRDRPGTATPGSWIPRGLFSVGSGAGLCGQRDTERGVVCSANVEVM